MMQSLPAIVAAAILLVSGPVAAAEPAAGTFRTIVTFKSEMTSVVQGDTIISAGPNPGVAVVFDGTAEPFRFGVFDLEASIMVKRSPGEIVVTGYGVRRDADGDEWHVFVERRGEVGRYDIIGGTGKYEGVTGTCSYGNTTISDETRVNMASCKGRR